MRPILPHPPSPPFPRCPPLDPLRFYQAKLDRMTVPQLQAEARKLNAVLQNPRADPKAKMVAQRCLTLVHKELISRQYKDCWSVPPRPPTI